MLSVIISCLADIFHNVYTMRCVLIVLNITIGWFKIYLLYSLVTKISTIARTPRSWLFLLVTVSCSIVEDISWISSMLRFTWYTAIDYRYVLFLIRFAWCTNIIMYQSFALFIESFAHPYRISWHQKIIIPCSIILSFYPLTLGFLHFNVPYNRPPLEFLFIKSETLYTLIFLIPTALIYTWAQLKKTDHFRIIKNQLLTITQFLVFPHIILNLWLFFSFNPSNQSYNVIAQIGSFTCLTFALFYSLKKIIQIRFLNIHTHVHSYKTFSFTNDFKNILDTLSSATTINEIRLLTQRFFNQAFLVPMGSVTLRIRSETDTTLEHKHTVIERFIGTLHQQSSTDHPEKQELRLFLKNTKVLIFDEVEFDHYYQSNNVRTTILHFLNEIQADIFIPVYEQNTITAYIIIERFARPEKLYSDLERDEMIIFINYLSKIINLLQNRNLGEMLKQKKEIMEELYLKHQEINQYKESIRSFLRNHESGSGIILYKNKRFHYINKEAHIFLDIDPNIDEGHQLTKQLYHIIQQTFTYRNSYHESGHNGSKKKIIISSAFLADYNAVLLTVNYPEIYDTIKTHIDSIKDPSNWDYLLYLETTQSGMLINQLIPGTGECLLNFKIELLKLALSKKAILIDLPEDDLIAIVDILHHISLREIFHTIELQQHTPPGHIAISLFGINPLYGTNTSIPLLEKLDKSGTLFIRNIHLLDMESQENLAQFIRYGFYTIYKSQKRVQHDVRIICSTYLDLAILVQEKTFSSALFNELKKTSLSMPSLLTLPSKEINQLVDGFAQQAITNTESNNFLTLTLTDRDKIDTQRPVSLHALKICIQQLLVSKSKKQDMYEENLFDPAYSITDPKLTEISRLGKQALKDPKIVQLLWNKFKSQNKIALFLGVNRSSVNRRFKEYNIA